MSLAARHLGAVRSAKSIWEQAHKFSSLSSRRSSCLRVDTGRIRTFAAMSEGALRPKQVQDTHPGKEHEMDPLPRHKRPNYRASGKLEVWFLMLLVNVEGKGLSLINVCSPGDMYVLHLTR